MMTRLDQLLAEVKARGGTVRATRLPAPPAPSAPIRRDPSRGGFLVVGFAVGGMPAPWCTHGDKPQRDRLRAWKAAVASAAGAAMGDMRCLIGPVEVWINFVVSPRRLAPDRDNLLKGTTDAMEGIAFRNDRQVVGGEVRRLAGPVEGAVVEVWAVDEPKATNGGGDECWS